MLPHEGAAAHEDAAHEDAAHEDATQMCGTKLERETAARRSFPPH
eukprot:gene758-1977_t